MSTGAEDTVRAAMVDYRTVRAARIRTTLHPGLKGLPDPFLACRQGHQVDIDFPDEAQRWRFYQPGRKDPTDVTELRWRCARCRSWVSRWVREDNGTLWKKTSWVYVRGFTVKNEPGDRRPVPRAEARLEWVRRFLERNPIPSRQVGYLNGRGRILREPEPNGDGGG